MQRTSVCRVTLLGLLIPFFLLRCEAFTRNYRESGNQHFYNLEYNEAIADFTKLVQQDPQNATAYNDLASAQLHKELYRLDLLNSSAFERDNRFVGQPRPPADADALARFHESLEHGRRVAETALQRNPNDQVALFSLCTSYALKANYEFMIEKAWISALRNGSKARGYCDHVRKLNPEFVDAYLVLGAYEYVAGSLPLPLKLFTAIGGVHGSKKRGIEYVTRVANEGIYNADSARVLLVVLYRREKRLLGAAHVLETLVKKYPRNYLFGLELASTYTHAGQPLRALAVLRALLHNADGNSPGYRRLHRETVRRQIEALQASLS